MAEQRTMNAERAAFDKLLAAAQVVVNEGLDAAEERAHPCDFNDDEAKARLMPAPLQALYYAVQAARRAPPALDAVGLPPLIWGDDLEAWLEVRDEAEIVAAIRAAQRHAYDAGQQSQAARIQHLTHERDLALAAARQSAPEGAPVAWSYEILQTVEPEIWCEFINRDKPTIGPKWLRNVQPLYATAAPTSASAQPADQNKMENNDE